MADDDADDPTSTADPGAGDDRPDPPEAPDEVGDSGDAVDSVDDPARPPGRVVQLQRPRPRRRRGSGPADPTRPARGGRGAGPASEGANGRGSGAGGHGDDDLDDAASSDGGDAAGVTGDTSAARASGVVTLTTLRGRRGRGEVHDGASPPADDDGGDDPGADVAALPALHPRMRSRRIAVRRSEGLRRLRRLTWGLAGLALLVDGIALAHTGFADVDRFAIAGTTHTLPTAVRHASGIQPGDALLTLDESGAERAVEALPWVAEADVVRQWPGTVRITVTERQPAAVLQVSDDPAAPLTLVDATGRVLEIGALPEGLIAVTEVPPELEEGGRVPAEARDALLVAEAASQRMPGTIVSLTVGLEATLGSGGVVLFGSADDLDSKLMALSTVLARVDLDCLESLNLAVPDHPALKRSC